MKKRKDARAQRRKEDDGEETMNRPAESGRLAGGRKKRFHLSAFASLRLCALALIPGRTAAEGVRTEGSLNRRPSVSWPAEKRNEATASWLEFCAPRHPPPSALPQNVGEKPRTAHRKHRTRTARNCVLESDSPAVTLRRRNGSPFCRDLCTCAVPPSVLIATSPLPTPRPQDW